MEENEGVDCISSNNFAYFSAKEGYDCTGQKKRFFNWIVQLYEPELTFFP